MPDRDDTRRDSCTRFDDEPASFQIGRGYDFVLKLSGTTGAHRSASRQPMMSEEILAGPAGYAPTNANAAAKGNNVRRTAIVVPLLSLLAGSALADTVFTPASGPKCKDESKEGFGLWTCPGPAGYAVRFSDEGNVVALTIAPARSIDKALPTAQWRGASKAFGDKVQWVMRGGVPKAAVIRTWRRKDGDDESEVQELSVFAIDRARACAYGAVDIHRPRVNDAALAQAEQAAERRCPKK